MPKMQLITDLSVVPIQAAKAGQGFVELLQFSVQRQRVAMGDDQ